MIRTAVSLVLLVAVMLTVGGCGADRAPEPRVTETVTATQTPSSSTSSPAPSTTPSATETVATPDEAFLNAAHLLEPRLEDVDDETVRGFGRAGCEAADAALAQGIEVRSGFSAFVLSMRINAERDPSQRENAETLQAVARAGVFRFCPQYLDEADALEVPL